MNNTSLSHNQQRRGHKPSGNLSTVCAVPRCVLRPAQGILFPALRRVKLIPEDAEVASLDYSRCGRTDKGVSALGQVGLCGTVLTSSLTSKCCSSIHACRARPNVPAAAILPCPAQDKPGARHSLHMSSLKSISDVPAPPILPLCPQVLCLKLRSAAPAGQPLPQPEQELDYPALINK